MNNSPKIVSVNCGLPLTIVWHGRSVTTSIYKDPIEGRVALRKLNLDGDGQADLSAHGGVNKAVYCYPLVHYKYWMSELRDRELPLGMFGENFTIDGLVEDSVHIGDRFSIGSAEVIVTQPRTPCYKLGIRFQLDDMVKRFLASLRTGFYLAVSREGEVGAGDNVTLIDRESNSLSVLSITQLFVTKNYNQNDIADLQRALTIPALPDNWKDYFRERLRLANA